jgi:AraC-like DNA-binding protein
MIIRYNYIIIIEYSCQFVRLFVNLQKMKAKKGIFPVLEGRIVMTFQDNALVLAQMENGEGIMELQGPSTRAEKQAWEELTRQAREIAARMRKMDQEWKDRVPEGANKAQRTLSRFQRLVQNHATSERNIGFYARRLQLTPHYLCALIKKTSGRTVMDWVNGEVIDQAKDLLSAGELQTQEVARELNFPDHASFTKFFKRETGLTPQAFRAGQSSSQS